MLRSPAFCWGWAIAVASLASVGCSMMTPSSQREAQKQAASSSGPSATQCTVDFRPAGKSPDVGNIDIPAEATVQQVLDKAQASKRFSRMNIELYRQLPNGAWHKMVVEYDRASKKVDSMHDYHVRPGDRLVIIEDTTDVFDDMMSSTIGPLGGFNRK
jgi:hypothetical protein